MTSMSLLQAHRQMASRATCLRSSYLEISRFFRTRHHGITPTRTAACSGEAIRSFCSSRALLSTVEPDEKLRKTLDEFKATSMFQNSLRFSMLI
jgi:aspartyl-tRNA synthetase